MTYQQMMEQWTEALAETIGRRREIERVEVDSEEYARQFTAYADYVESQAGQRPSDGGGFRSRSVLISRGATPGVWAVMGDGSRTNLGKMAPPLDFMAN